MDGDVIKSAKIQGAGKNAKGRETWGGRKGLNGVLAAESAACRVVPRRGPEAPGNVNLQLEQVGPEKKSK